ncbi:ABC transporter substrate-binding protein [Bombella sp. TMW 2.2559]|uniref:ABC transporter substrate-binding protein n=1 Tax=Bombella dulcis TaxID=2967339 RepID=A0ABT3WCS8_9PROT|nr:ABC transporter substrate-binding protein [Bombella dulcis]MCX5616885.1 ABC transporter substrate-binding protein [Bombella dulcis]
MKRCLMSSIGMMALLAGALATTGHHPAQAAGRAQVAPSSAATSTPQAPIAGLYKALEQSEHSDTSTSISQRSALIAPMVTRAFDMDAILKRSVGLHYDQLSAEERSTLVTAFRRFTVARYASTFRPGTDATFTVAQSSVQDGRTIVHTTIGNKGDPADSATSIDYVMVKGPDGWRIVDILLDGHISQVAAQRSDFKAIFSQSGATGLAHTLTKKADDFLRE